MFGRFQGLDAWLQQGQACFGSLCRLLCLSVAGRPGFAPPRTRNPTQQGCAGCRVQDGQLGVPIRQRPNRLHCSCQLAGPFRTWQIRSPCSMHVDAPRFLQEQRESERRVRLAELNMRFAAAQEAAKAAALHRTRSLQKRAVARDCCSQAMRSCSYMPTKSRLPTPAICRHSELSCLCL